MNIVTTDWRALSVPEQIRHLEVEGYVVLPDALAPQMLERLREETARLPTEHSSYHDRQGHAVGQPQWQGQGLGELIANPPLIAFLERVIGKDIIFFSGGYRYYQPGAIGVVLHTDGYPYGSNLGGYLWSAPVIVRASYYLDDLTEEIGPFRILPRSHICLHPDASAYVRYDSHPEEVALLAKAGDAVLFGPRIFHGAHPHKGTSGLRRVLLYGYRPAWASPLQPVDEWEAEDLAKAPEVARRFLAPLNTKGWKWELDHRPGDMFGREGTGVNPSRWERGL